MDLAERSGGRGLELEMLEAGLPVGPSSAAMRRRTNRRPIGGAADCNWASSAVFR